MNNRGRLSLTPISLLFLLLLAPAAASGQAARRLTLNVRDFGAVRDGKTKETAAFQQALDRCSVLGGCECEVFVPAGGVHNVTGSGLKGAAAVETPKLPEPVHAPATPYRLR